MLKTHKSSHMQSVFQSTANIFKYMCQQFCIYKTDKYTTFKIKLKRNSNQKDTRILTFWSYKLSVGCIPVISAFISSLYQQLNNIYQLLIKIQVYISKFILVNIW